MFETEIQQTIDLLRKNNIGIKSGMTSAQVNRAEEFYQVVFPPDMKELLMAIAPVSDSSFIYDWTDCSQSNVDKIITAFEWPISGALFDVRENDFWLKAWGQKPSDLNDRLKIAERNMRNTPKLVPIFGRRYIPSVPNEIGNPVFSVYQMDIIFYGSSIWEYFQLEYRNIKHQDIKSSEIKSVPFWYDITTSMENLVESYVGMVLPQVNSNKRTE